MATAFNDANAWINGQGNLSLGNAGRDDASADPAALYAKGDCFVNVPIIPGAFTSVTHALTFARTSAGLYTATLAASAATGIVIVPITGIFRKFSSTVGGVNNPHGFKLLDFVLCYTVGTVAATLPVATQANPYVTRIVPAAPIFVNTDNTDVWLEISEVNPGTAVMAITHLGYHCSVALY